MKIYTVEQFYNSFDADIRRNWIEMVVTLPFKTTIVVNNFIWPSDVRSKKIDDWIEQYCPTQASRIVNDIVCFENKNDAMMYKLLWCCDD
jgi:hypothetical protein